MDSEPIWKERIGGDSGHIWRGVKFLGQGGFGHVGLWQRDSLKADEEDRNEIAGIPRGVEKVAVKENFKSQKLAIQERRFQSTLTKTGSKHIVTCYEREESS